MQAAVRDAVLEYLRANRPGRLLDFPAGSAWLMRELGSDGWEYHAADLFTRPEVPRFTTASLNEAFPYDADFFDYVACLEGIEHGENYHHLLRQCHRVLKPNGALLLSTPNPLNISSRRRYYWSGTFYGFPHPVPMPAPGQHLHVSPINLSFLRAFAQKYGLDFEKLHDLPVRWKMCLHLPAALAIQAYTCLKYRKAPPRRRAWMRSLASTTVLLCDGLLVTFRKRPARSPAVRVPRAFAGSRA